jgi:tetratricopeptide (TPR) repeat protein
MRSMVRVVVVLAVVVLGATAGAQTPDPAGARLFEEGRALAKQRRYKEACAKFEESLALDPAIGTQLNYADCHEKLGQNAEAWRIFDAAADAEEITNPSRAKFARGRADAILPKVGVIVLDVATPAAPGLAITIGGRSIKAAAVIREIVDPGSIEITARAASGSPFQATETVTAGHTITLAIPAFPDPTSGDRSSTASDAVTVRRRSRVYIAYGVGAAGALSLASSIIVGLAANDDYQAQIENGNCQDTGPTTTCTREGVDAQNRARSLATVGTVLGVGGLALIAGGAVLFFTAPRDLGITPTVTSQSAGVSVVGIF